MLQLRNRILSFKKNRESDPDKSEKNPSVSHARNEATPQMINQNVSLANTKRDQVIKKGSSIQMVASPPSANQSILSSD